MWERTESAILKEKERSLPMIFDRLENLNQYTGLFEHLDTAIDYIESHDLSLLPPGRTNIDGENVYVNVFELEPKPVSYTHLTALAVSVPMSLVMHR